MNRLDYIRHLENTRNQFYAVNNIEAANLVQKDINELIIEERNDI